LPPRPKTVLDVTGPPHTWGSVLLQRIESLALAG